MIERQGRLAGQATTFMNLSGESIGARRRRSTSSRRGSFWSRTTRWRFDAGRRSAEARRRSRRAQRHARASFGIGERPDFVRLRIGVGHPGDKDRGERLPYRLEDARRGPTRRCSGAMDLAGMPLLELIWPARCAGDERAAHDRRRGRLMAYQLRHRRPAERRQVDALQCADHGAQIAAENYPFCTIEPNVGVVPVPDARLACWRAS